MPTIKRGAYSVHPKATTDISEFYRNAELQNQNFSRNDYPDPKHVRFRSSRTSRKEPQLPFNVLSCTQARRQLSPDLQLKTAEQIRNNKTVSTLQPFSSTNLFTTPRLDDEIRPEPGVLSHTHSATASTFPETQLSSRSESPPTASDDVFAVWARIGPENFRYRDQLGCGATQKSRHQVCGLLRRFSGSKPVQTETVRRHSNNGQYNAVTGLGNKLRKVCSDSDTTPRVSRHNMGHKTQRNVLVGVEVPIATQSTSGTAKNRQVVPQTVSNANGETQLRHFRNQKGSPSLSNSAILQSRVVEESPLPSSEHSTTSPDRDRMVAQFYWNNHADTYERCDPSTDNRRVRHRLGCSNQRPVHNRYMGEATNVLACKQKRDVCCIRSHCARTTSPTRCTDSAANGQPNSSVVHKQRRRHEIEESSRTNSTTSCSFRPTKRASSCSVLSRKIQRRSRRSITPESLSRMASYCNSDRENISDVGRSRTRSLCIKNGSCDTEIRLDGDKRSAGTTSQRILSSVALRPCVALSTSEPDSEGSQSPESSQREVHLNSTEMEQGILASRCSTSSSTAALSNPRPSTSLNRHTDRTSPARDSRSTLRSVADFGWSDMLTEWTDQEQNLLMSGWRPSTMNTYKPAWTRWKRWCDSNSVDFKHPTADQVARYLAYLHCNVGLAYRTILVHKSVISTFTHLNSHVDFSSNFFVKHMLKAISVARTKPQKPPIWNPKFLLQYLCTYRPDENNHYQVSKHTATLLLLASGRRVHDLTLLRIDSDSLIDEQTSIVLWPAFGSKTDNARHRQSGWRLREHPDKNLNVIFWIRKLLQLSLNRRNNLNSLFITTRGDPKPATRTIIGGWVKSLLRDANIEATPGSVRSAVASLNWLENFPLDKILATGNWRTEHTFRNYYQREIIDQTPRTNSVSLSHYFDTLDN